MYNGIGLQTARGSGTNGYVQTNLANLLLSKKRVAYNSEADIKRSEAELNRLPNKELIEHNRKRQIELKCADFEMLMENKGFDEMEILKKVNEYRKLLQSQVASGELNIDEEMEKKDTHSRAKAAIEGRDRMRAALGIKTDFVDGSSFEKMNKNGDLKIKNNLDGNELVEEGTKKLKKPKAQNTRKESGSESSTSSSEDSSSDSDESPSTDSNSESEDSDSSDSSKSESRESVSSKEPRNRREDRSPSKDGETMKSIAEHNEKKAKRRVEHGSHDNLEDRGPSDTQRKYRSENEHRNRRKVGSVESRMGRKSEDESEHVMRLDHDGSEGNEVRPKRHCDQGRRQTDNGVDGRCSGDLRRLPHQSRHRDRRSYRSHYDAYDRYSYRRHRRSHGYDYDRDDHADRYGSRVDVGYDRRRRHERDGYDDDRDDRSRLSHRKRHDTSASSVESKSERDRCQSFENSPRRRESKSSEIERLQTKNERESSVPSPQGSPPEHQLMHVEVTNIGGKGKLSQSTERDSMKAKPLQTTESDFSVKDDVQESCEGNRSRKENSCALSTSNGRAALHLVVASSNSSSSRSRSSSASVSEEEPFESAARPRRHDTSDSSDTDDEKRRSVAHKKRRRACESFSRSSSRESSNESRKSKRIGKGGSFDVDGTSERSVDGHRRCTHRKRRKSSPST